MTRGIQPEILATFEEILPDHGDLEEYLQSMVTQNRTSASVTLEEANMDFYLDRALILSFMEAQNVHVASLRNNSLDSELDAAIALSLEEPIAYSLISPADDQGATLTEPSDPVTAQDDINPHDMTFEQLQSPEEGIGTESRGLCKELLDSFPVQMLTAKSGWFSSKKSDPEGCTICVTEYEVGSKLLTLPCLHLYHKSCIKEWLKDNKTCPICNTDMSVQQA